jgi:hypothetical protein
MSDVNGVVEDGWAEADTFPETEYPLTQASNHSCSSDAEAC